MNNFIQWWRLRCSPVENNEHPKLELLGSWKLTSGGCPLSPCEGKSSQNIVSYRNKTIN